MPLLKGFPSAEESVIRNKTHTIQNHLAPPGILRIKIRSIAQGTSGLTYAMRQREDFTNILFALFSLLTKRLKSLHFYFNPVRFE